MLVKGEILCPIDEGWGTLRGGDPVRRNLEKNMNSKDRGSRGDTGRSGRLGRGAEALERNMKIQDARSKIALRMQEDLEKGPKDKKIFTYNTTSMQSYVDYFCGAVTNATHAWIWISRVRSTSGILELGNMSDSTTKIVYLTLT
jgi:hypothetical protein